MFDNLLEYITDLYLYLNNFVVNMDIIEGGVFLFVFVILFIVFWSVR